MQHAVLQRAAGRLPQKRAHSGIALGPDAASRAAHEPMRMRVMRMVHVSCLGKLHMPSTVEYSRS